MNTIPELSFIATSNPVYALVEFTFGQRLKALRKGQKYTQQQLASRLGVAKSVVSYYESGDRFPSYDVLIRIAKIFHVSTDYLLGIDKQHFVDVSGLSEEDISVVVCVAEALKRKNT